MDFAHGYEVWVCALLAKPYLRKQGSHFLMEGNKTFPTQPGWASAWWRLQTAHKAGTGKHGLPYSLSYSINFEV